MLQSSLTKTMCKTRNKNVSNLNQIFPRRYKSNLIDFILFEGWVVRQTYWINHAISTTVAVCNQNTVTVQCPGINGSKKVFFSQELNNEECCIFDQRLGAAMEICFFKHPMGHSNLFHLNGLASVSQTFAI